MSKKLRISVFFFILSLLAVSSIPSSKTYCEPFVSTVKIYAPAVSRTSEGYVGAVVEITVTVTNGSGEVYVSTEPLTEVDMQASARTAALLACQLLNENFNKYDFYVKVNSSSLIIGGPSAGAEMTIAIVAALKRWRLNYSVMMTGMINPDETIGPVGGIPEKMEAAAQRGVKLFLIPLGQRYFTEQMASKEKIGPFVIRKTKPVTIDLYKRGEKLGLKVKEIGDIREALYYFTNYYVSMGNYSKPPKPSLKISNAFKKLFDEINVTAVSELKKAENLLNELSSIQKNQIKKFMDKAEKLFNEAVESASKGKYYSAASFLFQSLYTAQGVEYLCRTAEGESMDSIVEEVKDEIHRAEVEVNSTTVKNLNEFELMIASQWRLEDAKNALNDAANLYAGGNNFNSILELAYAKRRAETALQWIKLTKFFNESKEVNWLKAESILNNYLYEAETILSYAQTLFSEIGYMPNELKEANNYLDEAENEYNKGNIVLAFGESLYALLYSSITLSLMSTSKTSLEYQVQYARNKTINSLWKSKNGGVESILSYAYFEFAESSKDEIGKLFHYKLSSAYSTALRSISGVKESPAAPKPPKPASTPSPTGKPQVETKPMETLVLILAFSAGLVLGTILTLVFKKRKEKYLQPIQTETNFSFKE